MILRLNKVLPVLRDVLLKHKDVEVAIIFGSIVEKGASHHDIDLAVKFSRRKGDLLTVGGLVADIAEALRISEDVIDIVDLERAGPALLWRILRSGMIIKGDESTIRDIRAKAERYPDIAIDVRTWMTFDLNPKLDKIAIISRIEEIRRNIEFLRNEILTRSSEELTYKDILALERSVHRIIEAMLDICKHLVAVFSLGLVESYGEYPRKLARAGKMPGELAEEVRRLAGLRNILVHRYLEVDLDKLYQTARKIVEEIANKFIEWVKDM